MLRVREMQVSDAEAVAVLSEQLGYKVAAAKVAGRFATIRGRPDNGLFVAGSDTGILGWIHVYGVRLLETDGYAEIGGVVVSEASRKRGVGQQLVQRAEMWAKAHGYNEVRLRSGLHRKEAHTFYQKIGYELSKTSHNVSQKNPVIS